VGGARPDTSHNTHMAAATIPLFPAGFLRDPCGIAVDAQGNLIVADCLNNRICLRLPDGTVSVLAGDLQSGFADGRGTLARFCQPSSVAVDADGGIIVVDSGNFRIRKVSLDGTVQTLAGSGNQSTSDGACMEATFYNPRSVVIDGNENIIVADHDRIRRVNLTEGTVSTLATHPNLPKSSIVTDHNGEVAIALPGHQLLHKVIAQGATVPLMSSLRGIVAQFNRIQCAAIDGDANCIVSDHNRTSIFKVSQDGEVSQLSGCDGLRPLAVAVDSDGAVLFAENGNIRRIEVNLTPPSRISKTPMLPSTFVEELAALLDDDSSTDVTFKVGDTLLQAHSLILVARSVYFRKMLKSGFEEGEQSGKPIRISDVSPSAFRSILRYLYTDELQFADEDMMDVMRKAREMQLLRVCNHTIRQCTHGITLNNAVLWFVKADEYKLDEMREVTLRFLTRRFRQIKAQARSTLQYLADKPHLMMEVMIEAI